jgi:L-ascorbate metabolism protein UlaG (beta-lactamase superfamily)
MEIVWMGHSCIRIKSGETTLIADPYAESVGLSMGRARADIVTISNDHPHHAAYQSIEGSPRVLQGPGEYEIGSFYISGLGTPAGPDPIGEGRRRVNTVYTIRAEGMTLCHLGDLAQELTPKHAQELSQADVLFVPAGGNCTIGATRLAALVTHAQPRVVVPIHYRIEGVKVELEPLETLLGEMGISEVSPQPRLTLTATNLPREMRVVVLQRAG